MRKVFTTLLLIGLLFGAFAQEYYIEGYYERHGEGDYTLKNVHTYGITIGGKTEFPNVVFNGSKQHIHCDLLEATLIKFSFEKANTNCPTRWKNGFRFQYWDEDNNKWKDDTEACKGEATGYSQKDMVIMLVLDYSSSMSNNISQIKSYAINFINTISKASHGNVHVGIIAFAGMDKANSQIFDIRPLTSDNIYKFEDFIRSSSMGTETALYYSMDKAMKMMEQYVSHKNFNSENFNGTCMITFTDGLDNASINDNISVTMHRGSRNEYLAYLSEKLRGSSRKMILGTPLESYIVGYTGSEDFSSEDLDFFQNVLQRTTPDESHFKLAKRFQEVEDYFGYITRQLTERWETINMYVGEAQHGRIRWVLNCEESRKKPDTPAPKTGRNVFLGLNFTLGVPITMPFNNIYYNYNEYDNYSLGRGICSKIGIDISWPLSERLSIGFYFNFGYNITWAVNSWSSNGFSHSYSGVYGGFDAKVGILMLAGELNSRPFIIGISPCTGFSITTTQDYLPLELRFGRVLSNHFYITGNINMGIPLWGAFKIEPSITLGWHFGDKIKMKR